VLSPDCFVDGYIQKTIALHYSGTLQMIILVLMLFKIISEQVKD